MKGWVKVVRTAWYRQGLTLGETGSRRQCQSAAIGSLGSRKAMSRSSFCFSCHGSKKSCCPFCMSPPSWKLINCFRHRKQILPILFKAMVRWFFRHSKWIVKCNLASTYENKCSIQFQKQSHPPIGDSMLLKIKCIVSAGVKWIKIRIAQHLYCPD